MSGQTEAQHRAWIERQVQLAWSNRYESARHNGFSCEDARLHADQAAALRRKELNG